MTPTSVALPPKLATFCATFAAPPQPVFSVVVSNTGTGASGRNSFHIPPDISVQDDIADNHDPACLEVVQKRLLSSHHYIIINPQVKAIHIRIVDSCQRSEVNHRKPSAISGQ